MSGHPNPPAFAAAAGGENQCCQPGMSLRDWFAGQAAIGISGYLTNLDEEELAEETAKLAIAAYSIADAMLAARGEQ